MEPTSRSLLQATYTPRKRTGDPVKPKQDPQKLDPQKPDLKKPDPEKRDPSKQDPQKEDPQKPSVGSGVASRGVEKWAYVQYLSPSLDELAKVVESQQPPHVLALVRILQKQLEQQPTLARGAKIFGEVAVETLTALGARLIAVRRNFLTAIEARLRPISDGKRGESSAGVGLRLAVRSKLIAGRQAEWLMRLFQSAGVDVAKTTLREALSAAKQKVQETGSAQEGFKKSLQSEPVGYLHLERLTFVPVSTERGELVHSVPLAPNEEIRISHKEWSQTTEEFERIVTDYLEEFSETGVTEKAELAQSVSTQHQHSTAFNTGVTASGEYGGVTVTATVGYTASESASESAQLSRNNSVETTHKASSRTKKEHKVSFKISSTRGEEDELAQLLRNPYPDRAARVDYFQLIRKWRVDLYRYGIRLTWDLTLPEPGSGLLSRMKELESIRNELSLKFEDIFPLTPSEITRYNYLDRAAAYGVSVDEAPPPATQNVTVVDQQDWASTPDGYTTSYLVTLTVPDGYTITDAQFSYYRDNKGGTWGIIVTDQSAFPQQILYSKSDAGSGWGVNNKIVSTKWNGLSGKVTVWVLAWDIKHWVMSINVDCALSPEIYDAWRMRVWKAMRDGVATAVSERRQMLQERVKRLEEMLGSEDALSLRKLEREEVMKGVLRWIGIEGFSFSPPGAPIDLETNLYDEITGLVSDPSTRDLLIKQGEVVRFLHQAVEWENILYFIYPYFWAHPKRWEFKKYIDHPDAMHRAFLKAGSARVVLTIRPGFEDAFLAFLNTGDMDSLPPSPYLEIGKEFQNYAQTNYPGIPPANPIKNARPQLTVLQQRAWADIEFLTELLRRHSLANGHNPTTAEGLAALAPDLVAPEALPTIDPWGNAYLYRCPGNYGDFDIASLGADGVEDGEEDNADITNWAEAALVGTWYEYTPTSALDIAFDALPAPSVSVPSTNAATGMALDWTWRAAVLALLGYVTWLVSTSH